MSFSSRGARADHSADYVRSDLPFNHGRRLFFVMQMRGEATCENWRRTLSPNVLISTLPPELVPEDFIYEELPRATFAAIPATFLGFSRDLFADKPMSTRLRRLFSSCPSLILSLNGRHDLHIPDCT